MLKRSLKALEYSYVQEQLSRFAMCSLGKQSALSLQPFTDKRAAENELKAVDECLLAILRAGSPPFGGITDIRDDLRRAQIGGSLNASRLLAVANVIQGGRAFRQYVVRTTELIELPHLSQLVEPMADLRRTEQEIRQAIDDEGQVVDHASDTLRQLRGDRRRFEGQVKTTLDRLLRTHQKQLQESVVALRGSYFCLPVRVEHKNQIAGIVRDVSSSGSTVFIEPQAVVDLGNRIREIELHEEREIERILLKLSQVVGEVADELLLNVEILATVDLWFAKGAYARSIKGKEPKLTDGVWRLYGARHPQLLENAVPISAEVGAEYRMLIVTGPNTGGKTVTLKTVGLLTLMAMSGLFIPTERESEIGFCSDIFVDIGDEQSIEQSLSTFSSHMKNIISMLNQVDGNSLVLLDELGAGTDPAEGSALAIAILNRLSSVGSRVVATTHYAELKGYAFENPQAMNASMEFDVESLRPTYRLLIGVPGRSNALAIASRLGLSQDILDEARAHVAETDFHVEELIGKLEQARREAEEAFASVEEERRKMSELRSSLEQKEASFDQDLASLQAEARREAQEIVDKAMEESTRIIKELRQMRDATGVKDHELVALRKGLEGLAPTSAHETKRKRGSEGKRLIPGSRVRVISLGQKGDILDVASDGLSATVQLGLMKMKVEKDDIEVLQEHKEPQKVVSHSRKSLQKDIRMELDIRGESVDDALLRIDKYLDDAVVSGLGRVVIIHGKGTGVLRNAVRRHVQRHPQVKSSEPGGAGEGGDGTTIVAVRM